MWLNNFSLIFFISCMSAWVILICGCVHERFSLLNSRWTLSILASVVYSQGAFETLYEAWGKYKYMLRKGSNHILPPFQNKCHFNQNNLF